MGAEILDSKKRPNTMGDFLELNKKTDATVARDSHANVSMPNSAIAQNHMAATAHGLLKAPSSVTLQEPSGPTDPDDVTRLHVHIRRDLADRLFEEVFRRKRDRSLPNKNSTQRVIIEQALEAYFNRTKK